MSFLDERPDQGSAGKQGGLDVVDVPAMTVVSIGCPGERTTAASEARNKLMKWLDAKKVDRILDGTGASWALTAPSFLGIKTSLKCKPRSNRRQKRQLTSPAKTESPRRIGPHLFPAAGRNSWAGRAWFGDHQLDSIPARGLAFPRVRSTGSRLVVIRSQTDVSDYASRNAEFLATKKLVQ
jgi:hypothetical protein